MVNENKALYYNNKWSPYEEIFGSQSKIDYP